jgi:hypothetical protein
MSVPEMKAFLGLIINMGLMPILDIKYHWSSEWITQITFFGDVMLEFALSRYFGCCMWEMIPPKKAVGPSKEQRKYAG